MKPELYSDADLCYTISVPLTTGIAALIIKWRKGIQYAFEVGDLWPDAPIEMGLLKNKILQAAALALEKYIYKRSALLVALSTPIKEAMGRKIIFAKKVHVIPNMADTDFYNLAPTAPSTLPFIEGKFVVSYIGAIGYANGLGYLLECARASQRAGLPVVFIICGAGALLPNLEKQAKALQLENLFFVPFQNREGVREILNASQAAMVSYRPVSILETGSPNKFFDGLAAGKLILINFGGWIKEEIETHTCGIYLNQKHPTDFVEKIKPFLKDGQLLKTYQQNARALAVKKYSRDFLSEKFVALVES